MKFVSPNDIVTQCVISSYGICILIFFARCLLSAKPRLQPGGLLVTRAFGDFYAKKRVLGGLPNVLIHDHGRIQYFQLSEKTRYLVLASDGLWDALEKDEVAKKILRKDFTNGHHRKTSSPCRSRSTVANDPR